MRVAAMRDDAGSAPRAILQRMMTPVQRRMVFLERMMAPV
jgi:hypothetical protein